MDNNINRQIAYLKHYWKNIHNKIFTNIDFNLYKGKLNKNTYYSVKYPFNNMENTIEKLKKLRDENPALAEAIEKEFPEIISTVPYVYHGTLFMKQQYENNIYVVIYNANTCEFVIRNVIDNKDWSGKQTKSNPRFDNTRAFLNKADFNKLLKQSTCSITIIKLLKSYSLKVIHKNLF